MYQPAISDKIFRKVGTPNAPAVNLLREIIGCLIFSFLDIDAIIYLFKVALIWNHNYLYQKSTFNLGHYISVHWNQLAQVFRG